ncbi:MAG: methionyl-tRNA formyltransferase, partial [Chlamydiota bacterium]
MKVIFFGTPVFAATILQFLIDHEVEVVAVVSKPDKPIGRSRKLVPTPVKEVALAHSIPLYQPEKISAPNVADDLIKYDADVFAVVAYGEILKQHILDMPKKACINLHASLLPKYRGAAPIQQAIINGEKETGVTVMHMVKAMDAGDIIKVAKTPIDINETYGEVQDRLCDIGSVLFFE